MRRGIRTALADLHSIQDHRTSLSSDPSTTLVDVQMTGNQDSGEPDRCRLDLASRQALRRQRRGELDIPRAVAVKQRPGVGAPRRGVRRRGCGADSRGGWRRGGWRGGGKDGEGGYPRGGSLWLFVPP